MTQGFNNRHLIDIRFKLVIIDSMLSIIRVMR